MGGCWISACWCAQIRLGDRQNSSYHTNQSHQLQIIIFLFKSIPIIRTTKNEYFYLRLLQIMKIISISIIIHKHTIQTINLKNVTSFYCADHK